jgi:hypothetical protein
VLRQEEAPLAVEKDEQRRNSDRTSRGKVLSGEVPGVLQCQSPGLVLYHQTDSEKKRQVSQLTQ